MALREIVNKQLVNLQNCDEEPIHVPGSIQSHGCLLAIDENRIIRFCSANTETFLKIRPGELLNKPLDAVPVPALAEINFAEQVIDENLTNYRPVFFSFGEHSFSCTVNLNAPYYLLEIEPSPGDSVVSSLSIFDQAVSFARYMQGSASLRALCQRVAEEVKSLTGYDRVMIYRFHDDYSGEIFAEAREPHLEAFFGLRYPPTDIPVQARKLYEINLLRLIPSVIYTPVPIVTLQSASNESLNMSRSILRNVSPIHLEYLHNMGVAATLTISLMHGGKLWGMIACHHYSEKYIDHVTRLQAQLQGHFLTSQILVREQAESFAISMEMHDALDKLSGISFMPNRDSLAEIAADPRLLSLCNASGAAIVLDGEVYAGGKTPTVQEILELSEWLGNAHPSGSFETQHLSQYFPPAAAYCHSAAGIMYHALTFKAASCVIWFRGETLDEVHWAGDPEKSIVRDESGLHPRKSFELWKETIRCKSDLWRTAEQIAAHTYSGILQKHISLVLLTEEETVHRRLTEELRKTNAELENINWIGTHDLKEPLRKIQVFSSRLLTNEDGLSEDVLYSLQRVNSSAKRMSQLVSDLIALGRLRYEGGEPEIIELAHLVKEVLNTFQEEEEMGHVEFEVDTLPAIQGRLFLIRQLLINLVSNAIKFRKQGKPVHIHISHKEMAAPDFGGNVDAIIISDNGQGFDPKYNEDVFKIFRKLNSPDEFEGSGIGLAMCRKIMQMHGGEILAKGRPDEGASFTLIFPRSVKL